MGWRYWEASRSALWEVVEKIWMRKRKRTELMERNEQKKEKRREKERERRFAKQRQGILEEDVVEDDGESADKRDAASTTEPIPSRERSHEV